MTHLSKVAGTGMLLAALTVMPALSQTTPAPDRPADSPAAQGAPQTEMPRATDIDDDNDFNFGWLGLLGLAGLAGIRRKPSGTERIENQQFRADTDRV